MDITLYTDGAARGNPGEAGIGIALYNEGGELIDQYCHYLGTATNNAAEYQALIAGLTLAKKYLPCALAIRMDSELLVRQLQGTYRVKNEALIGFYTTAKALLTCFKKVTIDHIPREKNKVADNLANQAIDSKIAPHLPQGSTGSKDGKQLYFL